MTDNVLVSSSLDNITVLDPTTFVPVTISEDIVAVGDGVESIDITVGGDTVLVAEEQTVALVTEEQTVIQPKIADVQVQIIEDSAVPYAKRTDFVGDTIIYKGDAAVGSVESNPVWRIRKLTIAADGDVDETWAGGSASFDKIWDDRLTEVYS